MYGLAVMLYSNTQSTHIDSNSTSIDWYSDVKSFSRSFENSEKEQFFFTVDQSNFRNKIPFVFTMTILFRDVYKIKCFCDVIMLGSEILTGIYKLCS